jgi:hypothetical protein
MCVSIAWGLGQKFDKKGHGTGGNGEEVRRGWVTKNVRPYGLVALHGAQNLGCGKNSAEMC